MRKCLIAGIDDDFRVRESLESLLGSEGYEICLFSTAEEFLNSASRLQVKAIISDVRMPGIGGFGLQMELARHAVRIPLIFISAHVEEKLRLKALSDGAVAFLYKPFDPEELLGCIHAALERVDHIQNQMRSQR